MIEKNKISPKNILVIRLSSLGDVILTTPFVRVLRNRFPDSNIDFLVASPFQEVFKKNPYLDNVHTYDKNKTLKEISYWKKLIVNDMPENKYDLIIDLQNNRRSLHFTNGLFRKKLKFKKKRIQKIIMVWFNIIPNEFDPIPERYIETASEYGLKPDQLGCELFFDKKSKTDENKIVIAPGAKHFTKRWIPNHYIALCNKLLLSGFKISLIGGKADIDICDYIAAGIDGKIDNQSGAESLNETIDVIDTASLVISNDSAAMHMAAARNIPIIALFGSTVQEFGFAPYNVLHKIIETDLNCRPCTHIGRSSCPKKHFNCMKQITPEIVYKSALNLLTK